MTGRATLEQSRAFATETTRVLASWGLPDERILSWELAVAEMTANVSVHGYPAGAPGPVEVELAWDAGGLSISVVDRGVRYDPDAVAPPPEPDPDDPSTWPEGGMGLMLVRSAGDELAYRREGEVNRLTLFTRLPRNAVS